MLKIRPLRTAYPHGRDVAFCHVGEREKGAENEMESETSKKANGRGKSKKIDEPAVDNSNADVKRGKEMTITIDVPLSAEELHQLAHDHVALDDRIDTLKEKKKADAANTQAEIVLLQTQKNDIGDQLKSGRAPKELRCYEEHDFRTQTVYTKRIDTNEVVGNPKGRAMTQEERQPELFGAVIDDDFDDDESESEDLRPIDDSEG